VCVYACVGCVRACVCVISSLFRGGGCPTTLASSRRVVESAEFILGLRVMYNLKIDNKIKHSSLITDPEVPIKTQSKRLSKNNKLNCQLVQPRTTSILSPLASHPNIHTYLTATKKTTNENLDRRKYRLTKRSLVVERAEQRHALQHPEVAVGSRPDGQPHAVALQVPFERQTLKPVFHLIGYRLWV
jgi:hypothetical protein